MDEFQLVSDSFGSGEHGEYLLDLDNRLGVVVECFLFAIPLGCRNDVMLHAKIASQGMDERSKRNEEYYSELNLHSADKLNPNQRFCISYDITAATSQPTDVNEFTQEYTYAFVDPPYPIRCSSTDEKLSRCSQAMTRLFGDLSEFTMRKWSTNWSNYFDAGNEWWGAFLWTLASDDGRGWWIGASTTD